jgi:ArsR family transcriptional regulator
MWHAQTTLFAPSPQLDVPPSRILHVELMKGLKALANPRRLRILELLKDPPPFAAAGAGSGLKGLTAKDLLKHLRCTQPSVTEQVQILLDVGLVESRKVGRWVLYTRDEERIRQLKQTIIDQLLP